MKFQSHCLAVALVFLTSPTVFAQAVANKVAIAGKPLKLHSYYLVQPDCSSGPRPTLLIKTAAGNGKLTVRTGTSAAFFDAKQRLAHCNAKRVSSTDLWYVSSRPGISDSIEIEAVYSDGESRIDRYSISVR